MKPVICSLCLYSELLDIEICSINSFINSGFEYHLYAYNNVCGMPGGVLLKDATVILGINEVSYSTSGDPSFFIHLFKLSLLYRNGGWWADMNVICLKPVNENAPYMIASVFDKQNKRAFIYTGLLKCKKESIFLMEQIELLTKEKSLLAEWECRDIFSLGVFKHKLERFILDHKNFGPSNTPHSISSIVSTPFKNDKSYFIILFSKAKIEKYIKNKKPEKGSFLDYILNTFRANSNSKFTPLNENQQLTIKSNFIVLLKFEIVSPEDTTVIKTLIEYIKIIAPKKIIVLEIGSESLVVIENQKDVQHVFLQKKVGNLKNKNLISNVIKDHIDTPFFCWWHQSAWISKEQLLRGVNRLASGLVDVCYPYESIYFMDDIIFYIFKERYEFEYVDYNASPSQRLQYPLFEGGVFIVKTQTFIDNNWGRISTDVKAFIERERFLRIIRHSKKVAFEQGRLYLLKKNTGINSEKNERKVAQEGEKIFNFFYADSSNEI
ncbi:MAG: hypothetical protein ABIN91_19250 [Mucilaginibacter sp.]|uniref:hypothetical protein n=1 Tax=Mucilaginibacter sp. TaxID=1882438 RepID=UPI003264B68A